MNDLISREALLESLNPEYLDTRNLIEQGETHLDNLAEGYTEVHRLIKTAPTVDAVEVVRCGKCEYWGDEEFAEGGYRVCECPNKDYATTDPKNHVYFPLSLETDFCPYGERKEVSE